MRLARSIAARSATSPPARARALIPLSYRSRVQIASALGRFPLRADNREVRFPPLADTCEWSAPDPARTFRFRPVADIRAPGHVACMERQDLIELDRVVGRAWTMLVVNVVVIGFLTASMVQGPYSSREQELWYRYGSLGLFVAGVILPAVSPLASGDRRVRRRLPQRVHIIALPTAWRPSPESSIGRSVPLAAPLTCSTLLSSTSPTDLDERDDR